MRRQEVGRLMAFEDAYRVIKGGLRKILVNEEEAQRIRDKIEKQGGENWVERVKLTPNGEKESIFCYQIPAH